MFEALVKLHKVLVNSVMASGGGIGKNNLLVVYRYGCELSVGRSGFSRRSVRQQKW